MNTTVQIKYGLKTIRKETITMSTSTPASFDANFQKYYFTFGSDKDFPYYGGWIIIEAANEIMARDLFQAIFPNKNHDILNCAWVYTEERFKQTDMYKKNDNLGSACHGHFKLMAFDYEQPKNI